eukprot:gene10575-22068_t
MNEIPRDGGFFFTWIEQLILKGEKKKLERNDMLSLPNQLTSKQILLDYKRCKDRLTQQSSNIGNLNLSIRTILHHMIFEEFWMSGAYRLVNDILVLTGPLLIKYLIIAAKEKNKAHMIFFATAISFSTIIQAISLQQFIHRAFNCAARVTTAVTALLFHSSMNLYIHKVYPLRTIGEINNIQSKDTSSLQEFVVFAHNLWSCPLTIFVCIIALLKLLGVAGLVSCILLPLLLPIESYISKLERKSRKLVLEQSDARMNKIYEAMEGIPFAALAVINIIGRPMALIPKSVSLYSEGMIALHRIESFINDTEKFSNTTTNNNSNDNNNNINGATLMRNSNTNTTSTLTSTDMISNINTKELISSPSPLLSTIKLENVSSIRLPNKIVLQDINLNLTGSGLVLIVGANAAGKTSLLLTILGELLLDTEVEVEVEVGLTGESSSKIDKVRYTSPDKNNNKNNNNTSNSVNNIQKTSIVSVSSASSSSSSSSVSVAYCGHDPWILNTTAKENITICRNTSSSMLNNEDEERRYRDVVEVCGLSEDMRQWPQGDETLIGERGINISGGQKARLSLARALYSNASILLLDSPLSSLDATVGSHIFHEAILSRTRPYKIIALENGYIVFQGSVQEFDSCGLPVRDIFGDLHINATAAASTTKVNHKTESQGINNNNTQEGRAEEKLPE